MQATIDSERNSKGSLTTGILFCLLAFSTSYADVEEETGADSDTGGVDFARLDSLEAIEEYRNERLAKVAEGLAESKLSDEHQELLANAITEMYLGIPLSSFTRSEREESSTDETSESSARWFVSGDGRIQHASESITYSLTAPSPFVFLPAIPVTAETGRVIEESDSEATFAFDLAMTMDAETDEDFSGLAKQMKWVAEVVVGKHEQSSMSFVMKLEKPVRKRFLFKLKTMKMEMHFSYVESCAGYAVNRMVVEVDGSAIVIGKLYEMAESTFSDIECEQPVVRLLPEEDESNFFEF